MGNLARAALVTIVLVPAAVRADSGSAEHPPAPTSHGAGTPSGYGVGGGGCGGMGRTMSMPAVHIGTADVKGPLDKAIVRRYVKRNTQKLLYCYEKQLLSTPSLAGTVTVTFRIGADGKIAAPVKAKGVDPTIDACVADVVKAIEFPKPKHGKPVDVTYPFVYTPTGG